jgi:hypothetical protein
MIDDTSKPGGKDATTPAPSPRHEEKQAKPPQERTKNPKDESPKWPGGGRKGEDEKT